MHVKDRRYTTWAMRSKLARYLIRLSLQVHWLIIERQSALIGSCTAQDLVRGDGKRQRIKKRGAYRASTAIRALTTAITYCKST
jgi:hypothetical protein